MFANQCLSHHQVVGSLNEFQQYRQFIEPRCQDGPGQGDIPIAKITGDYLEYLNAMEQCRIDLAGEFFVLAATLMRIKVPDGVNIEIVLRS